MTSSEKTFDFLIAGGGTAGCVIASRLADKLPQCTIAIVEVGPDAHDNPVVQSSMGAIELHGTDLHWNDETTPQSGAHDRRISHGGGRALSGGTAVNYGAWTRGHATDFDEWAKLVGDQRWSYNGLLPYFKKTETYHSFSSDISLPEQHGDSGPIHTVQSPDYPLGETILQALTEAGQTHLTDANGGQPLGVAKLVSNSRNVNGTFVRQPAGHAYGLSKVKIFANTQVRKIIFDDHNGKPRAKGIEIASGKQLFASKEVIVCCGAFRTPQLLMLSGLGDASHLKEFDITSILDIPAIGSNLHDHPSLMMFWKVKYPERALSLGHPDFDTQGIGPTEWLFTGTVPSQNLAMALTKDGIKEPESHTNLAGPRAHFEITFGYLPAGAPPGLPLDGSIVTTGISNFLPTSRGSVRLKSADPQVAPLIDPAYLLTEHDQCILRHAVREVIRIMDTAAAKSQIDGQFSLPEYNVGPKSSDQEIDDRVRATCLTWYHIAGTAAMGSVVDSECHVLGTESLRVVDASIMPLPIGAHYQASIYAIAEQAADMIASSAGYQS